LKIQFKLFASLKEYLPASTKGNQIELEVETGTTPAQLIEQYQLPPKLAHLVLVNGHYIEPDRRASVVLQEGDALAIWPPVAGG
jgi:thiamine biosynthesis protein ThiS